MFSYAFAVISTALRGPGVYRPCLALQHVYILLLSLCGEFYVCRRPLFDSACVCSATLNVYAAMCVLP